MSSGSLNEKLEFAKNKVVQKVNKYSYHLKELTVIKSSQVNSMFLSHLSYFQCNYISKAYENPFYFMEKRKAIEKYADSKLDEAMDEFKGRADVTKKRLKNAYYEHQYLFTQQTLMYTLISIFFFTKLTKKF